jgi:acetyl-CoA carboxylase beta subunit
VIFTVLGIMALAFVCFVYTCHFIAKGKNLDYCTKCGHFVVLKAKERICNVCKEDTPKEG